MHRSFLPNGGHDTQAGIITGTDSMDRDQARNRLFFGKVEYPDMNQKPFKNQTAPIKSAAIHVSRLHSIKTRLLVFALIATIIPSVALGSLAYLQITRFLNQKIYQGLQSVTAQVTRELDLSIKERMYDVRIFSSSYIIIENLTALSQGRTGGAGRHAALGMISDYLQSVRKRFADYGELILAGLDGGIIASSNGENHRFEMPPKWSQKLRPNQSMVSEAYFDQGLKQRVVVISDPIQDTDNRPLGVLGAKLSIQSIESIMAQYAKADTDAIYLIDATGDLLAASGAPSSDNGVVLDPPALRQLADSPEEPAIYRNPQGRMVIGTMSRLPALNWRVVVEADRDKAFRQVSKLQRLTLILAGAILLAIGACAYVLALTIVQPLKRLSQGADQVASGDLNVDLPVRNRSEVGYLTQVFNQMVEKLRNGREELDRVNAILRERNQDLHKISITDPLTGLSNRKHLMEALSTELVRSVRHEHAFGLLLIDIDHFKQINDTYGHQKGDAVLCRLAAIFKENIRKCDYAARYGGEEFILLLTETASSGAREVAQRICRAASQDTVPSASGAISYTVSIGVGIFPADGKDAKSLIEHADKALYTAKKAGRNQVRHISAQSPPVIGHPPDFGESNRSPQSLY